MPTDSTARGPAARLRAFFFAEEVPYGLAAIRILLPLVLLTDLSIRWPGARELYSSDGATAPIWVSYGFPNALPELPGGAAVALFTLLLAALVTSSLGWMTRASLAVATVLYFYFTSLDCLGTLSKYTVIANHVLLLLAVSNCGAVWSIDALRNPNAGRRHAVWPARLIQLLIGIIYFGAAMTKVHTPSFFSGDQMMFWMLTHVNEVHPIGERMAHYPALLIVAAYATIVWEVLFLFLCWRGWGRRAMIGMGVGFHFMTILTLGLYFFPATYFSAYFAFMNERDAAAWAARLERLGNAVGLSLRSFAASAAGLFAPARRLGPVTFALSLWSVAVAGAAAERYLDHYRERGPNGPIALKPMDPDEAREMLAPVTPIRTRDKIFSFEIGSGLFGDTIVGRRSVFRQGDLLVAQCVSPPPHEDMYVECHLYKKGGAILERTGGILFREANRQNFTYSLCEAVEPGDYEVALVIAGEEVARRRFTLLAGDGSAPAGDPSRVAEAPGAVLAN